MATEQGSRSTTREVSVAIAVDEHRRRVARFLDHQQGLRRESAQERARALDEGRLREASLLDRFDECLAETGIQLGVLIGRLESARNFVVDANGRAPGR